MQEKSSREIRMTNDGSLTVFDPEVGETFHSTYGARNESLHVFIRAGLQYKSLQNNEINILEVGLGTGLNVLLSLEESVKKHLNIHYTSIEPYPLDPVILASLYDEQAYGQGEIRDFFSKIHDDRWNEWTSLLDDFHFKKIKTTLEDFVPEPGAYDVVYFDAFSPAVQPELWTEEIFGKLFSGMKGEGVLVTYSAKGQVRRNMQSAGFRVERLPGPAGKREMLRGIIAH